MNRRYQIYHASTVTTNAAAFITCPRRGKIRGVAWAVRWDCTADGNNMDMELSFASVGQQATDDGRGVISNASVATNIGAAGADHGSINFFDGPMELDVLPGDRIYYNVSSAGAAIGASVRILIEIDES